MRYKLILLLLTFNMSVIAQKLLTVDSSYVKFFSETPVENIEAYTQETKGLIDVLTNKFAFSVLIKTFVFDKELMKEHFNESYMESEKHPTATFIGVLDSSIDWNSIGVYTANASGTLLMHGVQQKSTIETKITITNHGVFTFSEFNVKLEDFQIERPKIVFYKIAEQIKITTNFKLSPKK